MANYDEVIQPLLDQGLLVKDEVYYYHEDPLAQPYQIFFDFCFNNLQKSIEEFNLGPSHVYYGSPYEINACAYGKAGHKFISIYMGALEMIWTFYEDRAALFGQQINQHYNEISAHRELAPYELLYQYTTLYFYYHELGHLIQYSDSDDGFSEKENLGADIPEDGVLAQHALELDADWFAASQLALHLIQYYQKEQGELVGSLDQISRLISLGLSAIFNYFILSAQQNPGIYYEERSHPHPIVRISYVLVFLMDTFKPNLPDNFELNLGEILTSAIELSEQLLVNEFGNQAMNFAAIYLPEAGNIEAYIKKIMAAAESNQNLAKHKLA